MFHKCLNYLLIKTFDIPDSAVSKKVGNTAHILAYLFNAASRQHHEDWDSQFHFLTT